MRWCKILKMSRIETGMSISDYHQQLELSSTGLKEFMRSPGHYREWLRSEDPWKSHLDFGNAAELFLVDPAAFADRVFILPEGPILDELSADYKVPRQSKRYKTWKADQLALAGDRYVINDQGEESFEVIGRMAEQVEASSLLPALIAKAAYQSSYFWTDAASGVALRTRPDLVIADQRIVIDIKTARDGSPGAFRRQSMQLNYPLQAAFHSRGLKECLGWDSLGMYLWVVLEKSAPYSVTVYSLDLEDLAAAEGLLDRYLGRFAAWTAGNLPDGYSAHSDHDKHGVIPLTYPEFYFS